MNATVRHARLLIGGEWVSGASEVDVLDKFSLELTTRLQIPARQQVVDALRYAQQAFEVSTLSPFQRGEILDRAASALTRRTNDIVESLQREAGFTLTDAAGELRRCIETLSLSAEEARRLVGEMVPIEGASQQADRLGFTLRVPMGVVCAITPFNAPLNTVAHKVGPALAAGNAVVLKPSRYTPTPANLLAEALIEAELPAGLLSVVHGGAEVAGWLLDDPRSRFFAFTGSTDVGREIQRRAGLRRTQMELGSIAFTILAPDADLDRALPKIINASYRKAGQVCTSIQILLVHASIQRVVEERLVPMVQALRFGDPADPKTFVGPVISEAEAVRIAQWIEDAIAGGARRLAGGPRVGAVVPPTLLTNISDSLNVSCKEIFGPVMSIVSFDTIDDAIAKVNGTPYGLATGIFTNRLDDALRAARRLQVGGVHINETSSSRVDLMPYGGSKESGFGREGPRYAIHEMTEERMITIAMP